MNISSIIKSAVSLSYGILFLYLVFSDKILKYLHPRMEKFVLAAGIVLIIAGIYCLKDIKKNIYMKVPLFSFSVFLIPLIAGLLIDPSDIAGTISASRGMSIQQLNPGDMKADFTDKDGNIYINSENYIYAMREIYSNIGEYEGRRIEVEGFVFRNEYMGPSQMVVGRYIITCCIADASLFGYLTEGDGIGDIPENTWVKVKGKLGKVSFEGEDVPCISADEDGIEFPERPENEYVFANY